MQGLSSNPNIDVDVVVDDAANHATPVDAAFSLVDDHSDDHVDTMIYLADVVCVLFLSDVVMPTSSVMSKMVVLL